ncbi:MAG: Maf family protein [Lachnospiraceae bacterium]|nr:Maf family protein [Lachnospiraceae bacterium]
MRKMILASASPRRRELLTQAGFSFEVKVSDADEIITEKEPDKIVKELALVKACAVAASETEALIIGADTIVTVDGKILGKPRDAEEAFSMLSMLQGRTHQVYTGVALITKEEELQKSHVFSEKTDVHMYPMTKQEIREYIATGEPLDKAGAYGIQGRAAVYIRKIEGDYNNVVGLPISRLYQELKSSRGESDCIEK